ncbi:MAG: hypothetical protein ABJN62_15195 [Halioglobus sp.]
MRKLNMAFVALLLTYFPPLAIADSTEAACEVYPRGEDHTEVLIPCSFSQRQGYITITRSDGVVHDLSPVGDSPGNYEDGNGHSVFRQSGLGDQGQIFRFPKESVYVYWGTGRLMAAEDENWTAPFSTQDYEATTKLRCRGAQDEEYGSCPAGIARMDDGQASITVQNQLGEQFTINFLSDHVNATNREVSARMEGDVWIIDFAGGEVLEVPLAAIEGG